MRDEPIDNVAQGPIPQMQSFTEDEHPESARMHPAFALYCKTGCWGTYSYQGDHLSDVLSGKKQKNKTRLSTSRSTTFSFSFTSDRVEKRKGETITPEMTEMVLSQYTQTNNCGNNSFKQDRNGDLFSGKKRCPQSTRGTTFYISDTSSRKVLPDGFDATKLILDKLITSQ